MADVATPEEREVWEEYSMGLSMLARACENAAEGLNENSMSKLSDARAGLGRGTTFVREAEAIVARLIRERSTPANER